MFRSLVSEPLRDKHEAAQEVPVMELCVCFGRFASLARSAANRHLRAWDAAGLGLHAPLACYVGRGHKLGQELL